MKLFHKIRKTRKKNEMKKQEQAKNMRLKCMEKLGETQEREGKGIKRKRTESNNNNIIKYLNGKNEKLSETKSRELELKEKELKFT